MRWCAVADVHGFGEGGGGGGGGGGGMALQKF